MSDILPDERLNALLDATENGILLSDRAGRLTHVNRIACEMLGLSRDAVLGRSIRAVMHDAASRFSRPAAFRRRVDWLYDRPLAVARDNLTTTGPTPRLYQRYSAPFYESAVARAQQTPAGRLEVFRDVTENRQMEAQMRRYLDEMMSVHRIGVMLSNEQDPDALLDLVCQQAAALVGAMRAAVGLLREEEPDSLVIPAACGMAEPWEPRVESVDQSLLGPAILQRRPIVLPSSASDPLRPLLHQMWGAVRALCVPLESRDRVIGGLVVFREEARAFDAHEVQLLQIFASQAAVTIENARLLAVARERRVELEALTDYNNLLIEHNPVGIAVIGPDGRFQRGNPAFKRVVQASGASLKGVTVEQVFPQAEESGLLRLIQTTLEEGDPRHVKDFHYPYLTLGHRWFDLTFNPLRDGSGQVVGVMMTLVDITQRKRLEEDLRQRNERINRQLSQQRALYEVGTQINAVLDPEAVLDTVMATIRTLFSVDGLSLAMPQGPEGALERVSAVGLSEEFLAAEQALVEASAGGEAVAQRAPVLVAAVHEDERLGALQEAAQREGIHTALFLPFVFRDEVVALMALYHRTPYPYNLEEMELLTIFVNQATSAIKNAQLYAATTQGRSNLNAILQSMTDGVIALDRDDCVIFVNQPLFDLLGLPSDQDWTGCHFDDLWPTLQELWRRVPGPEPLAGALDEAEGVVSVEVELRSPARTLELVHAPIADGSGARAGRLLLLHDITQLRASERIKDELLSVLSHELRTPLTSILGYSKLLADRPQAPAERRARWAAHILDKSHLLNQLVNEVLDLSRLNVRRFEVKAVPTDLGALAQRLADEHQALSERCLVEAEVVGDVAQVRLDPARIEQLLMNLLTNAVKYSPEGGRVKLRVERDDPWVRLSVRDEGIGIAPEHHERIFEPFFRVDNSTTRAVYGTGLGLPLCRGIAQAHGGDVSVESTPGEGSIFRVRLPLDGPPGAPSGAIATEPV